MGNHTIKLAALAIALTTTAAQADGLYGTFLLGYSAQANDSEPFGDNIAADSDFPGQFDSGDGGVVGLGLGYAFNEQFRLEGRLAYRKAKFNDQKFGTGARDGEEYILDGDLASTSLTVEGFYDIPTQGKIQPYVKAGIGISRNSYAARLGGAGVANFDPIDGVTDGYYDNYADQRSTEFAWNVGLGASMALTDNTSIFGEYQYVSLGDASTAPDSFTDGFRVDAAAHEVVFGLRTQF